MTSCFRGLVLSTLPTFFMDYSTILLFDNDNKDTVNSMEIHEPTGSVCGTRSIVETRCDMHISKANCFLHIDDQNITYLNTINDNTSDELKSTSRQQPETGARFDLDLRIWINDMPHLSQNHTRDVQRFAKIAHCFTNIFLPCLVDHNAYTKRCIIGLDVIAPPNNHHMNLFQVPLIHDVLYSDIINKSHLMHIHGSKSHRNHELSIQADRMSRWATFITNPSVWLSNVHGLWLMKPTWINNYQAHLQKTSSQDNDERVDIQSYLSPEGYAIRYIKGEFTFDITSEYQLEGLGNQIARVSRHVKQYTSRMRFLVQCPCLECHTGNFDRKKVVCKSKPLVHPTSLNRMIEIPSTSSNIKYPHEMSFSCQHCPPVSLDSQSYEHHIHDQSFYASNIHYTDNYFENTHLKSKVNDEHNDGSKDNQTLSFNNTKHEKIKNINGNTCLDFQTLDKIFSTAHEARRKLFTKKRKSPMEVARDDKKIVCYSMDSMCRKDHHRQDYMHSKDKSSITHHNTRLSTFSETLYNTLYKRRGSTVPTFKKLPSPFSIQLHHAAFESQRMHYLSMHYTIDFDYQLKNISTITSLNANINLMNMIENNSQYKMFNCDANRLSKKSDLVLFLNILKSPCIKKSILDQFSNQFENIKRFENWYNMLECADDDGDDENLMMIFRTQFDRDPYMMCCCYLHFWIHLHYDHIHCDHCQSNIDRWNMSSLSLLDSNVPRKKATNDFESKKNNKRYDSYVDRLTRWQPYTKSHFLRQHSQIACWQIACSNSTSSDTVNQSLLSNNTKQSVISSCSRLHQFQSAARAFVTKISKNPYQVQNHIMKNPLLAWHAHDMLKPLRGMIFNLSYMSIFDTRIQASDYQLVNPTLNSGDLVQCIIDYYQQCHSYQTHDMSSAHAFMVNLSHTCHTTTALANNDCTSNKTITDIPWHIRACMIRIILMAGGAIITDQSDTNIMSLHQNITKTTDSRVKKDTGSKMMICHQSDAKYYMCMMKINCKPHANSFENDFVHLSITQDTHTSVLYVTDLKSNIPHDYSSVPQMIDRQLLDKLTNLGKCNVLSSCLCNTHLTYNCSTLDQILQHPCPNLDPIDYQQLLMYFTQGNINLNHNVPNLLQIAGKLYEKYQCITYNTWEFESTIRHVHQSAHKLCDFLQVMSSMVHKSCFQYSETPASQQHTQHEPFLKKKTFYTKEAPWCTSLHKQDVQHCDKNKIPDDALHDVDLLQERVHSPLVFVHVDCILDAIYMWRTPNISKYIIF